MIRHIIQIAAITILAVACMFYPFLAGPHDRLAVTLSVMAQVLGLAGLLLVPIGALWLIYELVKRPTQPSTHSGSVSRKDKGYYFALVALTGSFVVAAVVALGASTQTGFSLGLGVLIVWAYLVWRSLPSLKSQKSGNPPRVGGLNPTPLYLIFVPSILVIVQLAFIEKAIEFSRNRTIMGSAEFINAIEAYRDVHGHYPLSLSAEHHDYDPPIIGIEQYHYEPAGRAYNVYFEQFISFPLGTREFVMYNTRDEHVLAGHDSDRLLWTAQEQAARPGYYAVHDASTPHWKYFWFD